MTEMPEFAEDDLPELPPEYLAEARGRRITAEGMARMGALLGLSIDDALSPALRSSGRITACEHFDRYCSTRRTSEGRLVPADGSSEDVFMCALHPHGEDGGPALICRADIDAHYTQEHHGEY